MARSLLIEFWDGFQILGKSVHLRALFRSRVNCSKIFRSVDRVDCLEYGVLSRTVFLNLFA